MMDFRGRTAVVTGGAGALGSVVVEHFVDAGANIAIPVRRERDLTLLPAKIPGTRVHAAVADLSVDESVRSFVDAVTEKFAGVHYLVNIAGGYAGGHRIEDVPLDEWDNMMNMNLRSSFLVCRSCLRVMRKQNVGRIVNISAMPALTSGAKKGPYAISKRGVIALTETIADEVKGTGITANAIAPSIILTEANRLSMPDADFSNWVTPKEIAHLILYLCSDEARSVSGNVIKIFGGV